MLYITTADKLESRSVFVMPVTELCGIRDESISIKAHTNGLSSESPFVIHARHHEDYTCQKAVHFALAPVSKKTRRSEN